MVSFRSFFILFTLISLAEVLLFVKVGEQIGPGWTILSVLATATIGVSVLRYQGFLTLKKIQTQLNQGQLPGQELVEGAMLMVGGALLITPGFLTDSMGFALMVPMIRGYLAGALMKRGLFQAFNGSRSVYYSSSFSASNNASFNSSTDDAVSKVAQNQSGNVIEGDYDVKEEKG